MDAIFEAIFELLFRIVMLCILFFVGAAMIAACSGGRLTTELGRYSTLKPASADPQVKCGWFSYTRGDKTFVGEFTTCCIGFLTIGFVTAGVMAIGGVA
jgi:hypothetical protein